MTGHRHWENFAPLFFPNSYCKQPFLASVKPQSSRQYHQPPAHFDNLHPSSPTHFSLITNHNGCLDDSAWDEGSDTNIIFYLALYNSIFPFLCCSHRRRSKKPRKMMTVTLICLALIRRRKKT